MHQKKKKNEESICSTAEPFILNEHSVSLYFTLTKAKLLAAFKQLGVKRPHFGCKYIYSTDKSVPPTPSQAIRCHRPGVEIQLFVCRLLVLSVTLSRRRLKYRGFEAAEHSGCLSMCLQNVTMATLLTETMSKRTEM